MPQGSHNDMTRTATCCRCIRALDAGAGARATCNLWQGLIYGLTIMRQARERTGRTTGDVGGKKGRKEGETTFETVEAAQEAVARRQEGPKEEEPLARTQDSGLRRAVRETGGRGWATPAASHLPCTCLHLTPGTHTLQERWPVSGPPASRCSCLPLLPRSFLLLGRLAGWLLLCCYYAWLLDGWLPPSFKPDLPGQSCLTTSSNQSGPCGVQSTAWGGTSEWPEVGGVS
ncbi:uncharacterized protein BDZ83DRAFT_416454 [Colletotrichum acutatum]|uniref:Uncharacterized protein n=1 Tax=Glomerella acutata TaxID=27357 RepID=A0AAD8XCW9_GLOAC|nr:uncharacterized protein BDZ83DRAFT_416454 [Colletotrichum acutatum]KAK1722562.1 hypothetical protein BDZ83DRAFT_416454 [Colletotrichum acutatum]